jgi:hypothetical protein
MTNAEVLENRILELERKIADLKRHNEQLREAIAALLAPDPPAPVNDKDRLFFEHHPYEALREKYR